LGERFAGARIDPDTNLRLDLDVDSLEWVALTMDLQSRLGLALPEEAIAGIETIRDLLRQCAEAGEAGLEGPDLEERLRDPEALLDADQVAWLAPPSGIHRPLGALLHGLARWSMRRFFHLRASGLEHLPREGPCILAPNHLSALDPVAILAILDREQRVRSCWGGWTGLLFHRPWTRLASRSLRVLPVDPHAGPVSSLAFGAAALGRGCVLVWFPEGSRSEDGALQTFRPGVGILARSGDVPVVPVRIEGSGEALPPRSSWLRLRRVQLWMGEPLTSQDLEPRGHGETPAERIADALRQQVQHLGTTA
jgi:long-chain acyl-CoA synthetase